MSVIGDYRQELEGLFSSFFFSFFFQVPGRYIELTEIRPRTSWRYARRSFYLFINDYLTVSFQPFAIWFAGGATNISKDRVPEISSTGYPTLRYVIEFREQELGEQFRTVCLEFRDGRKNFSKTWSRYVEKDRSRSRITRTDPTNEHGDGNRRLPTKKETSYPPIEVPASHRAFKASPGFSRS